MLKGNERIYFTCLGDCTKQALEQDLKLRFSYPCLIMN